VLRKDEKEKKEKSAGLQSPREKKEDAKERERRGGGEERDNSNKSPVTSPRAERHREETRKVGDGAKEKSSANLTDAAANTTTNPSEKRAHIQTPKGGSHDGSKESEGKPEERKKPKVGRWCFVEFC
jgi:hypothetical protein